MGKLVVASDQGLLGATREDLDGLVQIDVWVGAEAPEEPAGQLVFDGELFTLADGHLPTSHVKPGIALPVRRPAAPADSAGITTPSR